MDKLKKRFIAILMAMAMTLCFTISAFAAEPVDVISPASTISTEEASTRASVGKQIAFGATTINNGSGSLTVHLSSGNFFADIVAQIAFTPVNSVVTVTCTTPDNDVIYLGNMVGTGARSNSYELLYAPKGDYTFFFSSAITEPYEVAVYFYD